MVTISTAVYLLVLSSKLRKVVVTSHFAYSYTKFMKKGKIALPLLAVIFLKRRIHLRTK